MNESVVFDTYVDGAILIFSCIFLLGILSIVYTLALSIFAMSSQIHEDIVKKSIPEFHKEIDVVLDGKHWLGKNLSFLHATEPKSRRDEDYRIYRSEILCKSNSGNYILLFAAFEPEKNDSYMESDPKALTTAEAMNWSSSYPDVYHTEFGQPEIA